MAISIENLFFNLVYLFDFIVICQIFYLYLKGRTEKQVWLLFIYCFSNSLCNLISYYTSYKVDYYLYGFFTLVEYGLISYFIFLNLRDNLFKKIILYASIFFFAFNIYHTLSSSHKGLDSVPIAIETILVFLFCVFYLYTQMNTVDDMFIYNKYQFWVVVGFLVYLGGSFFIYILANNISRKILDEYWFLTYVFYIIKNILFVIGISFLVKKRPKKLYVEGKYSYLN